MAHYAAHKYFINGTAQYQRNVAQVIPVRNCVVEAAKRTVDPILAAWREANPTAQTPHWYAEIEAYCRDYPDRAWTCCSLFVQAADIAHETRTHYLLLMVYKAVIGADTYHDKQVVEDDFLAGCLADAEDDRKLYADLKRGG